MVIKNNCVGSIYIVDLHVVLPKNKTINLSRFFSQQEINQSKSLKDALERKLVSFVKLSPSNVPLQNLPKEFRLQRPAPSTLSAVVSDSTSLLVMEEKFSEKGNKHLKEKIIRIIEKSFEEI